MSSYVNVPASDLQINDRVRGRGRVVCNVDDHETLEGFVRVVFSKGGNEKVAIIHGEADMQVKVEEDYS